MVEPFDGDDHPYEEPLNTPINWWNSLVLEKGKDPIRRLALRLHAIMPHNADCERVFSILGWFLGKRRTKYVYIFSKLQISILTIFYLMHLFYRIDTKRLQAMVQMHSYLVTNAKSELKFLDDNVTSEELNETFNQIALAMNSGDDLFDDDDVLDISHTFEDHIFNEDDEIVNLEGINNDNLEISDFIDLTSSLFANDFNLDNQNNEEESIINHGDPNFDIDELIDNFELI
jgi:hypothetical protein